MVTQTQIARRVGVDVSSVNKILNHRKGPVFRKETVRRVLKIARELGYDFGRLKHPHKRRHERKTSSIGVEILVHRVDGTLHDRGKAVVEDFSPCGARLGRIDLPSGSIPVGPIVLTLRPWGQGNGGAEIRGRLVRFHFADGAVGLGIEFEGLESDLDRKLRGNLG